MRLSRFLFLTVVVVGAALPALALSDSGPDELERNRAHLEKIRADPDHYARLQRDLQAFLKLAPERQDRIRDFDRELHETDSAEQKRLWEVLERYTAWVERLPESEQQQIDAAADRVEKLRLVRQFRDKEWLERLPRPDREELTGLPEEARSKRLAELRKEERQRRADWVKALRTRPDGGGPRPGKPVHLGDFPKDVQSFVAEQLTPMLSNDEKDQLKNADGKWPLLAHTILELSDRHPVLPPLPAGPIVRLSDLPDSVRKALPKGPKIQDDLKKNEGKWPQFALGVVDFWKRDKRPQAQPLSALSPLGASRPAEFGKDLQAFLETKLPPALGADDKERLHNAEGHWPDYPLLVLELSRKVNLVAPGMSLPGGRELWDGARSALPEVPTRVLRDFAANDLTQQERAALRRDGDPAEYWERIKEEYFKRNPRELQKLRRLDQQTRTPDKK